MGGARAWRMAYASPAALFAMKSRRRPRVKPAGGRGAEDRGHPSRVKNALSRAAPGGQARVTRGRKSLTNGGEGGEKCFLVKAGRF